MGCFGSNDSKNNLPREQNRSNITSDRQQNNSSQPNENRDPISPRAPKEDHEEKKVVPVIDALESKKYYALGILSKYLKEKGIENEIIQKKVKDLTEIEVKENNKFLQTLVNTFSDQKKINLTLDCGPKQNQVLINAESVDEQNDFLDVLKALILKHFSLNENDIEITPPKNTETEQIKSFKVSVIFKNDISKMNKLNVDSLKKAISRDIRGCKVEDLQANFLLDKVTLNLGLVNQKGDVLNGSYGQNEKRGGREYFSPGAEWKAYGLDIKGKIKRNEYESEDNNEWLGFIEGNEWPIAYYGTAQSNNPEYKDLKNDIDKNKCNGKTVGEGVYITRKPEIMEKEALILELGDKKKYKVGFMVRVHPTKLRISTKNEDYWVVEGDTKELRPYRILIKEV